jgi:hypothetical protein
VSNLARKTPIVHRNFCLIPLLLLAASCGARFTPAQLSVRDYAVLSDFLRSQLARRNGIDDIRVGPKGSMIAPLTMAFLKPLEREMRDSIIRNLKGVTFDTIESFEHCARNRMLVSHTFNLPVEYEMATPEETRDIKALYTRHPRTNGYVQFSCVGVNLSDTQALFSLERLMTHSAVGKWILMERGPSGKWMVKQEYVTWIA